MLPVRSPLQRPFSDKAAGSAKPEGAEPRTERHQTRGDRMNTGRGGSFFSLYRHRAYEGETASRTVNAEHVRAPPGVLSVKITSRPSRAIAVEDKRSVRNLYKSARRWELNNDSPEDERATEHVRRQQRYSSSRPHGDAFQERASGGIL